MVRNGVNNQQFFANISQNGFNNANIHIMVFKFETSPVGISYIPKKARESYIRYLEIFGMSSAEDILNWDIRQGRLLNDKQGTEILIQIINSAIDNNLRIESGRVSTEIFPIPKDAVR
tara:strand:- start:1686 stop:2039 length:354 start_codon:yes stop_codon:yes gene_type:complete